MDWVFTVSLATWLNVMSTLGITVLSVPAFSLNSRKKTLARVSGIVQRRAQKGDKNALDAIATELEGEVAVLANRWRPVDEICLFIGYFLLLGASFVRVFAG